MSLTPAVLEARVVKAEAVDEPVLLLPGEARDLLACMEGQAYLVQRMRLAAEHCGSTGRSSDAMVLSAFMDDPWLYWNLPLDRGDWRRCLLAYALAPEFLRERMRPMMREYRRRLDDRYWRWAGPKHPTWARAVAVLARFAEEPA